MKKIYIGILAWSICLSNVGIVNAADLYSEIANNEEISSEELEDNDILNESSEDILEHTSDSFNETEQSKESDRKTLDIDQMEELIEETQNSKISESINENKEESSRESTLDNSLDHSDVSITASGQNGTGFIWTLYEDGLLTFGGGVWSGGFPPWYTKRYDVRTVVITDRVETSLNNSDGFGKMFYDCRNLTSINGLELLDTENSKSFGSMFYYCESLKLADVSSFDTSNSTSFQSMFYNCYNLEVIDVSNFDTRNATSFSGMFETCWKVTTLDVFKFNTEKATSLDRMFAGCRSILELDVSNFNTENCTNFSQMFANVRVDQLNISNFETKKATDMSFMFQAVSNVTELDLTHFETQNVKNMEYMFQGMKSLTKLDLKGWDVSNVQKFNACFSDLTNIEFLDLSHFVTSSIQDADYVFRNLSNLKELKIDNWILPAEVLSYKAFSGTIPEKMSLGPNIVLSKFMELSSPSSGYVWVDKNDELIYNDDLYSAGLINFHNTNGISNTYRIQELYTLTFNTNGGSEIANQKNISGKTWFIPEIPEKNGYIFDYWSLDKEGKNAYDFTTPILNSLTLYAQYTPAYVVTIPASVNLNQTNQVQVTAENFQKDKSLSISTSNKVKLINTYDTSRTIEKELTTEKEYSGQGQVLEVIGKEKKENILYIHSTEGIEPAGIYKGNINFIVEYY